MTDAPLIDAVSGLVEGLRATAAACGLQIPGLDAICSHAADALEAQARELAEARKEIARLRGAEFAAKRRAATDEAMWRDAFKTAMKNGDRMLAAEARIAALEDAVRVKDEALKAIYNCGQSAEPDHWKFRVMARDRACTALSNGEPHA